jgi:hypothetical protein
MLQAQLAPHPNIALCRRCCSICHHSSSLDQLDDLLGQLPVYDKQRQI